VTAKEKRDLLFKKSKPAFKPIEVLDGEGYSKDLGYLWAAYKKGSFPMPMGLTEKDFAESIEQLSGVAKLWLVEDTHSGFKSGRGPTALITTRISGLVVEPKAIHFQWASKRNRVRAVVGFLNMLRYSKKTGIVLAKCDKDEAPFFHKLKDYEVLYYMGKSSETECLFSVRGRGSD